MVGLILILAVNSTSAQDSRPGALHLREFDDDGGERAVHLRKGIVDVNSTIDVTIDKTEVRKLIADRVGIEGYTTEDIDWMVRLQGWASGGLGSLPEVEKALNDWNASDKTPNDIKAFQDRMDAATRITESILSTADGTAFDSVINQRLEEELLLRLEEGRALRILEQYQILFEEAEKYAQALQDSLDGVLLKEAVYIVLAAWIRSKSANVPLHLAGFDSYPEGEYHRVERWNFTPTEEQRQQIEQLHTKAKNLNERSETVFRPTVSGMAETSAEGILSLVEKCVGDIGDKVAALKADADSQSDEVRQELELVVSGIEDYLETVSGVVDKYRGGLGEGNLNSLIDWVLADLDLIDDETDLLIERIDRLTADDGALATIASTGGQNLRVRADEISTTLRETCYMSLKSSVTKVIGALKDAFGGAGASSEINDIALEWGQEVIRHDIESMPSHTSLDLHFTGKRASGDVVHFKLGAARVDPVALVTSEQPVELASTRVKLFRVLPHFETTVGLIAADPSGTTALEGRFQYAPSYSVLLKIGSRSSSFYNRCINIGVGLNLTALDFDKDDELEAGFGVVGSILKDYLQAGYGFNASRNQWYWFFGVRLPTPSIGFPGGSTEEAD
jgi:hypothetical protein